ncbi:hypothetical protein GH714_003108 [Hevea brasiliensis]|uniref:DUF1517 domain-containing protein n=1 Tax=Hevea brasiliensis TaxID=3981 RepID=A0A6A6KG63_HEVBR|nr:hypothetical protein GH714_003108 [Hevea brasiliensis]
MATASLLESSPLKWRQSLPIQLSPPRPLPSIPYPLPLRPTECGDNLTIKGLSFAKFSVECSFMDKLLTKSDNNDPSSSSSSNSNPKSPARSVTINPFKIIYNMIIKSLEALKKPAIATILVGLLLMYNPNCAFAASGGRMGGRSFSQSSSLSSRSYSVPHTSSSGFSYSVPYYAPSPLVVVVAAFTSEGGVLTDTARTSVLKLQVGLLGMGRSLQRDLNQIAEIADTSSSEGLSYVLTETSLALLRHPDYCISGYSYADVKQSIEDGEKRFNQLSIEERGKFDEETLVNVNNIKKQATTSQRANRFNNEHIVITILVAAEGAHKLPTINGSGDLKEALQKLGSIPTSKILAVEVLWTPQNENDTLTEPELLEDYPLLRPL